MKTCITITSQTLILTCLWWFILTAHQEVENSAFLVKHHLSYFS